MKQVMMELGEGGKGHQGAGGKDEICHKTKNRKGSISYYTHCNTITRCIRK